MKGWSDTKNIGNTEELPRARVGSEIDISRVRPKTALDERIEGIVLQQR